MSDLASKQCIPCRGGVPKLQGLALQSLLDQLGHGWKVISGHHLEKDYAFKDFKNALAFVNRVGALAEKVQHHPDLLLSWGRVRVTIWTHKIDGLTESDFVFAAKTEKILEAAVKIGRITHP